MLMCQLHKMSLKGVYVGCCFLFKAGKMLSYFKTLLQVPMNSSVQLYKNCRNLYKQCWWKKKSYVCKYVCLYVYMLTHTVFQEFFKSSIENSFYDQDEKVCINLTCLKIYLKHKSILIVFSWAFYMYSHICSEFILHISMVFKYLSGSINSFSLKLFIGKAEFERVRRMWGNGDLPSSGSLLKWLPHLGLAGMKRVARIFFCVSPVCGPSSAVFPGTLEGDILAAGPWIGICVVLHHRWKL